MALGWFDEDERDGFLIGVFPDAPQYPEPSFQQLDSRPPHPGLAAGGRQPTSRQRAGLAGAYCCYSLAYDRGAKVAIFYGGLEEDRGTWAFDFRQKKWQNLKPKTSAPPLFLQSTVYDSVNKVTLLFGGQTGKYSAGKTVNETRAYSHARNGWE